MMNGGGVMYAVIESEWKVLQHDMSFGMVPAFIP